MLWANFWSYSQQSNTGTTCIDPMAVFLILNQKGTEWVPFCEESGVKQEFGGSLTLVERLSTELGSSPFLTPFSLASCQLSTDLFRENINFAVLLLIYLLLFCILCLHKCKNVHYSISSPFIMYSHHIHVSLVLEAGYGQEIITQDSNLKNANLLSREK